jgi:hypothetical protein
VRHLLAGCRPGGAVCETEWRRRRPGGTACEEECAGAGQENGESDADAVSGGAGWGLGETFQFGLDETGFRPAILI